MHPGNILLREDGSPVIADFGLAREVSDDESFKRSDHDSDTRVAIRWYGGFFLSTLTKTIIEIITRFFLDSIFFLFNSLLFFSSNLVSMMAWFFFFFSFFIQTIVDQLMIVCVCVCVCN